MTRFNDPRRIQKEVGTLFRQRNRRIPGHFNDLCALLGHASPAAVDPTGNESFCFQKRVVKDAELFALEDSGRIAEESNGYRERGFADVWKRGFFAWEY